MHVYLLIYSDKTGDRVAIRDIIDAIPEIAHWRYDMPNSFYLQSENTAQELTDLFVEKLNREDKRFLICEITKNRQGYLPQKTWDFIDI